MYNNTKAFGCWLSVHCLAQRLTLILPIFKHFFFFFVVFLRCMDLIRDYLFIQRQISLKREILLKLRESARWLLKLFIQYSNAWLFGKRKLFCLVKFSLWTSVTNMIFGSEKCDILLSPSSALKRFILWSSFVAHKINKCWNFQLKIRCVRHSMVITSRLYDLWILFRLKFRSVDAEFWI